MQTAAESRLLTIAIPTWQRPKQVACRVAELALQLVPGCEVIVYENGETLATRKALEPYLSDQISYRPSLLNQGPAYNMARCITESRSEWLWMLGDDDSLLPHSIANILSLQAESADAFVTTRAFNRPIGTFTKVHTPAELFANITLSEALFMSGTVWRRSVIAEYMETFLLGAYTMSSQLCVMLSLLDRGHYHGAILGENLVLPKIDNHRWSRLRYMQVAPAVLEFVTGSESRHATAAALWTNWIWAAQDSLGEIISEKELARWRDAFWSGLLVFRHYAGGRRFMRTILRRALTFPLRRVAQPNDWCLVALLDERRALSLALELAGPH